VLYPALAQFYRERGWKEAWHTTINDSLLDAYLKYMNLLLNHALLHIRAKSVEVSQAQLDLNNSMYKSGVGTRFAIMQSRTQLASDQQALLQQQLTTRQAALALAYSINLPVSVNLVPIEESITEQEMVNQSTKIETMLTTAIHNRPDLRQYEYFRVSAARNVQTAASPLYPNLAFFTTYTRSSTTETAGEGAFASSASLAGAGVFGGLFNTFQTGMVLSWTLPSLGLSNVANIVSARALSRQSLLQANQQLLLVQQQVRQDYLAMHIARDQIDNAAYGVASGAEELRLAELRLKAGVGTNLELIQAQRDYINALITQAQAIIASNQAQAQLVHDSGTISVETLTRGYSAPSSQ
jgi:OMF family outer membrane factor